MPRQRHLGPERWRPKMCIARNHAIGSFKTVVSIPSSIIERSAVRNFRRLHRWARSVIRDANCSPCELRDSAGGKLMGTEAFIRRRSNRVDGPRGRSGAGVQLGILITCHRRARAQQHGTYRAQNSSVHLCAYHRIVVELPGPATDTLRAFASRADLERHAVCGNPPLTQDSVDFCLLIDTLAGIAPSGQRRSVSMVRLAGLASGRFSATRLFAQRSRAHHRPCAPRGQSSDIGTSVQECTEHTGKTARTDGA